MSELKDIAPFVTPFITAVISFFTARSYYRKRKPYQRANITQQIDYWPLEQGKVLLQITISITNQGEVMVFLTEGFVRVQQIKPIVSNQIKECIENGTDPIEDGFASAKWPLEQQRILTGEFIYRQIEPSETEEIVVEFVMDEEIEIITAYTFLTNPQKKKKNLGWHKKTTFELKNELVGGNNSQKQKGGLQNGRSIKKNN